MSHQSIKDLVDVTGTPTDGQILKYTASSTSWGPAAESGGGSSGAEYLEIWQEATHGNYLTRATWATEAPSGTIVHNSMPAGVCFTRANAPSGVTYSTERQNSDYDNILWFRHSSTDTYLLEVDYLIKHENTSEYAVVGYVGIDSSDDSNAKPSFSQSVGINSTPWLILQSFTDYYTLTSVEGTRSGYTGRLQRIVMKTTLKASELASTKAYGFGFGPLYSTAMNNLYLDGHSSAFSWDYLRTLRRHVKITKIA